MTDPQAPAIPRERDPDPVNAGIALQRAALRAREKAWRHGVPVVYSEDGVIKHEYPPTTNESRDGHASGWAAFGLGVTTAAAQDPLTFAVSLEANFKNRQT